MIQMMVSRKIGNKTYHFTFPGNDLWEVLMESQKLGFRDVFKCGLCDGENLYLKAYETAPPDKYHYVKIACAGKDCHGQLTLGQRKDDGTYYLRKNEDRTFAWQKYDPKGQGDSKPSDSQEDMPF